MEHVEVLASDRRGLVLYAVERSGVHPLDIAGHIHATLGPETVVSVRKGVEGVTWRILTLREDRIPALLRKLDDAGQRVEAVLLRKVPRYEVAGYLRAEDLGAPRPVLTPAEQAVLRVALRAGFYEQPKRCGIADIARQLEVPPSTAHYRLKNAERKALQALASWS